MGLLGSNGGRLVFRTKAVKEKMVNEIQMGDMIVNKEIKTKPFGDTSKGSVADSKRQMRSKLIYRFLKYITDKEDVKYYSEGKVKYRFRKLELPRPIFISDYTPDYCTLYTVYSVQYKWKVFEIFIYLRKLPNGEEVFYMWPSATNRKNQLITLTRGYIDELKKAVFVLNKERFETYYMPVQYIEYVIEHLMYVVLVDLKPDYSSKHFSLDGIDLDLIGIDEYDSSSTTTTNQDDIDLTWR